MNETEMPAVRSSNLKRIKQHSKASPTGMARADLIEMVVDWKLPMYFWTVDIDFQGDVSVFSEMV